MALVPGSVGDNPFVPGVAAETYIPDQLIAGDLKLVTLDIVLLSSILAKRGTVVGRITATGKYLKSVVGAVDGSQVPVGVVVDDIDASAGDKAGSIYQTGEFNGAKLLFDGSWTLATLAIALRPYNIFIKTPITAGDPS